jgi:hypothetical protein
LTRVDDAPRVTTLIVDAGLSFILFILPMLKNNSKQKKSALKAAAKTASAC